MHTIFATPWRSPLPPWCNRPVPASHDDPTRLHQTPDSDGSDPAGLSYSAEPSSGIGRRHGTSFTAPFDRWFRYPAGFASDYAATLLDHLGLRYGHSVTDPFAGSAVTGTAAQRAGLSFYGIEAHPLIAELGQLKLQASPAPPSSLVNAGRDLLDKAEVQLAVTDGADLTSEAELTRRCFRDETLIRLTTLRDLIISGVAGVWSGHLKWALLATLRDVASVRVGWPYQQPGSRRQPRHGDVFARFTQRFTWMAADLSSRDAAAHDLPDGPTRTGRDREIPTGVVVHGDARDPASWAGVKPGSVHGCVCSPPYLNNFDYADATRLELYFWGEVTSWSQMCQQVRNKMIIATTQQSSMGSAATAAARLQPFGTAAAAIEELTAQLRAERTDRKRGKEYDRVVPAYFAAITQILGNLAGALAPGAAAVLLVGDSAPYGIYIDTPTLIAELSQHVGFSAEKDVVLRRRGLRWATNSQRHRTELTERLVLLRRQ
jgi:hypothetical protein